MRRLFSLLVLAAVGCGGAARPQPAAGGDPAPAARPLDTIAQGGTWYLVLADRNPQRCEAWRVGEVGDGVLELVATQDGTSETLLVEADGDRGIQIVERTRETASGTASQPCAVALEVKPRGENAVAVGRGRWFRTAAACEAGRQVDEPVLTDLGDCRVP